MQAIWAFITDHWIVSSLIGVPLIIMIWRMLRTRSVIASTMKTLFPGGRPAAAQGREVPAPQFSGKNIRWREMSFYGTFARRILGPCVDKRIVIRRDTPKDGREYGKLYIFLGHAPRGEACLDAPKTCFGETQSGSGKSFAYSGCGTPIIDADGTIVAEYHNDSIYFLTDPNQYGIFGGARVFARVMAQAAALISGAQAIESADNFADALERALKASLEEKAPPRKKVEGSDELEDLSVTYQRVSDEALASERESIQMRSQAAAELGKEYDQLCQVKKVTSVSVTDKEIEVHTDTLYCTDPATGNVYEMGRFKIRIPLNSGNPVRWKNLTRQVDGYDTKMMSLHVYKNEKACLGNTGPWFKKLISERKFADAAKLAIAFVETVNPEDTRTYKYIDRWPKVRGGRPS